MSKFTRPTRTAPRERVATAAELADEAQRWERARSKPPAPIEANLVKTLLVLSQWKPCSACGALTLYVNEQAKTDTPFACTRCERRRADFGERCKPSFPVRAMLHLRALFTVANDNHQVRA